ncbi:MAG: VanZ family protein [Myxococcota bacterium]
MPVDAAFAQLLPERGASAWVDVTMVLASTVGLVALAVLAPARVLRQDRRFGAAFVIALSAGLVATLALQLLVGRPRPDVALPLLPVPGLPSFPSGHAALAAIAVVFLLAHRRTVGMACVPLALLVAVSRVHVGHHQFTDVLGGGLLGLGIGIGATVAARGASDDPWRWRCLLWPQVGLVSAISLAAYTGSLAAADPAWLRVAGMDKVLHFTLFGFVAFGMHFATRGHRMRVVGRLAAPTAIVVPLVIALADEGVQALSPHRSADVVDLLADLAGMLVFRWLARRITP